MENIQPFKSAPHYAAHGLKCFPLIPGGKEPYGWIVPNGANDATTDPDRLHRWWLESPSANIGIATDGLLVIDLDPRNGGDPANLPDLPETWTSITGSGGLHIWFRLPPGANPTGGNGKLGRGLDVKTGAGSYVVAAPSRVRHGKGAEHHFQRYHWRQRRTPKDIPLATAPDRLIRKLTPPPAPPPRPFVPRDDDEERVRNALQRIPAYDREVWLRVGMSLKSHFGERGRTLWDEWSATCPEKFDPKAQIKVWRSFRRGGVGIGTIFWLSSRTARHAA